MSSSLDNPEANLPRTGLLPSNTCDGQPSEGHLANSEQVDEKQAAHFSNKPLFPYIRHVFDEKSIDAWLRSNGVPADELDPGRWPRGGLRLFGKHHLIKEEQDMLESGQCEKHVTTLWKGLQQLWCEGQKVREIGGAFNNKKQAPILVTNEEHGDGKTSLLPLLWPAMVAALPHLPKVGLYDTDKLLTAAERALLLQISLSGDMAMQNELEYPLAFQVALRLLYVRFFPPSVSFKALEEDFVKYFLWTYTCPIQCAVKYILDRTSVPEELSGSDTPIICLGIDNLHQPMLHPSKAFKQEQVLRELGGLVRELRYSFVLCPRLADHPACFVVHLSGNSNTLRDLGFRGSNGSQTAEPTP